MNLNIEVNAELVKYSSNSQKARLITENWINKNSYCPSCGNEFLIQFSNNRPVADFFCKVCTTQYELKSQKKSFTLKVLDGAYSTMIQRINSENNPSFFFMNYSIDTLRVIDLMVVPKYYFTDEIIEKRKPLKETARRAGWTGCNILLGDIPKNGKIYLVKNETIQDKDIVLKTWSQTSFLATQNKEKRGWTLETLKLIDNFNTSAFTLKEVYLFETLLKNKFPNNNFIKDKIRQQLQILRDKGIIEFLGQGRYRKIHSL
jgi:type II restriction enzyme